MRVLRAVRATGAFPGVMLAMTLLANASTARAAGDAGAAGAKAIPAAKATAVVDGGVLPAGLLVRGGAPANAPAADHPGPLPPGADTSALPAGHPMVAGDDGAGAEDDQGDPGDPGDMPGSPAGVAGASPHGTGGGAGSVDANGIFRAPEDVEVEDPSLPPGTIAVRIVDASGLPVAHAPIVMGILKNSIAQGDSREKVVREADVNGAFVFSELKFGSGIAYRVTSPRDNGTFAAMPFNLPAAKGMRVTLHVYDVSSNLQDARVVFQAALYVEVKEDRVQFEELFAVFNFGKVAWVPAPDTTVSLPAEYTAFNTQQEMSDTGAEAVVGKGIKLHGTFGPGRHDVTFRWQLPYEGTPDLDVDVGLPPHVATARVVAAASPGMTLQVDGFPAAQMPDQSAGSQRVLATEKQSQPNDPPLRSVHLHLHDLPTAGPARLVATGIAGVGVLAGFAFAFGRAQPLSKKPRRRERALLLAELEDLERAHAAGEIGPKTYERARRELIDALASTLVNGLDRSGVDKVPTTV